MAKTPEEQLGVPLPPEPVAEQQAQPEPEAQQEERPSWLDERFKSPEELAHSYSELENKLKEQGRERNELADRLTALESEREQYQQFDPNQWYDPASDPNYLAQQFEEDPVTATRAILQQELAAMQQAQAQQYQAYQAQQAPFQQAQLSTQAETIADLTAQRMSQRYDDWPTYQDRAQEILQNRTIPQEELFNLPKFQSHVDEAYRLAKYEALEQREQAMQEAGISQEEIDRQMKLAAQTMSGRSARPEEVSPTEQKAAELLAAHRGTQHYGSWASQNVG